MLKGKTALVTGLDERHRPRHCRGARRRRARMSSSTALATRRRSRRSAPIWRRRPASRSAIRAADMGKPDEIAAMIRTRRTGVRRDRHPRQQCRHPARGADRGISGREMGRDHRASICRRPSTPSALALPAMKRKGWGRIINTAIGPRPRRLALQGRLCRGEARHRRADQDGGARDGARRHHRQRHLPRLRLDAAGREADPGHGEGPQPDRGTGQDTTSSSPRSRPRNSSPSTRSRRSPSISAATRRSRSPARCCRSTAAGPRRERDRTVMTAGGATNRKPIALALQGGGAHGAFTWGVLDKLIEDGRLDFEAISGTSAGAMNAVVLADGLTAAGRRTRASSWRNSGGASAAMPSAIAAARDAVDPHPRLLDDAGLRPAQPLQPYRRCRPTASIRSTSIR